MERKEFSFRYGETEIHFSLDQTLMIGELALKNPAVILDPVGALKKAIRNPVGTPPLREIVKPGQTVAFIVNDLTRLANSHIFLPVLLNELNEAGLSDKEMFVIFALGAHRLMTKPEMIKAVGSEVAGRVAMYNSDATDASQFTYFGTTSRGTPVHFHKRVAEADHIICTGSILYHFFCGFGGGRKAMLPGVASCETIRHNHSMMLDPNAIIGKLDGNPVYHDQIEGTEMRRPSFLLNVVLNERREFVGVFAGDYVKAHREGCRLVESVNGATISEPADLVIASCGGYPKDINVYQMQKTMDNAWLAVREGGVVIIVAECIEGSGSALYEKWMRDYVTPEQIEVRLREDFQLGAHKAYAVTRLMKKAQFILISSLDPDLSRTLLFKPAKDMDEALRMAFDRLGRRPSILLMPQGNLTVPIITK